LKLVSFVKIPVIPTFFNTRACSLLQACGARRAGLKGGDPRLLSLEGPYDVFNDVIVCKIYVFAKSQRSRLLFPVVDYAPVVLTRLLAALIVSRTKWC